MLIISGLHAREYAPPELAMRFAETLVDGYNVDADITWLLQHTEIHLIIYVNPDGRYVAENDRELFWRKSLNPTQGGGCSWNNTGVDLNRNYDFAWGDTNGSSSDPCDNEYHGKFSSLLSLLCCIMVLFIDSRIYAILHGIIYPTLFLYLFYTPLTQVALLIVNQKHRLVLTYHTAPVL